MRVKVNNQELNTLRIWVELKIDDWEKRAKKANPLTVEGQTQILKKIGALEVLEYILTEKFYEEWTLVASEEATNAR